MRRIDVGILLSDGVEFSFNGDYRCGDDVCTGRHTVSAVEGKICWQGALCDRLLFEPCAEDSFFTIENVVIGIDFHWQRKERQSFKGSLLLFVEEGRVRVVNRVAVEDYLVSVISSEMSATSSMQLLKAHAVISRSWLYAQLERAKNSEAVCGYSTDDEIIRWYAREDHTLFDFCADDHCQRYQGITMAANSNVERAVKETENMVLASGGKVCDARFSKCCGGVTERFSACWEDSDVEYLTALRDAESSEPLPPLDTEEGARAWIESVPDAFCSSPDGRVISQVLNSYDQETADFYRWTVVYDSDTLSALVREKSGIDFGLIKELLPMERGASGRIVRLKIVGTIRSIVVGKELEIRRWLSPSHLYSSAFVVDKQMADDGTVNFVLQGAGWGHGVGLCQIGAAVMGEKGYSYKDILAQYYPGTELKNINNFS